MKKLYVFAALAALIGGVAAYAAGTAPLVPTLNADDAIQVVPHGVAGGAGNVYATPGQIAGVPIFVNGGVVVTAFTHTFANTETNYFVQPAGTLATGVLTTALTPSNGQRECFLSTQTQTALTWTANTGQTVDSTVRASAVAYVPTCIEYVASTATWYNAP